mmetsp:Transcript_31348/g.56135  ORF Transcript_31348/g.56135 Transcript_31348/m.56135 type:complete len:233 (-) Transcript_31348:624-1322(-)
MMLTLLLSLRESRRRQPAALVCASACPGSSFFFFPFFPPFFFPFFPFTSGGGGLLGSISGSAPSAPSHSRTNGLMAPALATISTRCKTRCFISSSSSASSRMMASAVSSPTAQAGGASPADSPGSIAPEGAMAKLSALAGVPPSAAPSPSLSLSLNTSSAAAFSSTVRCGSVTQRSAPAPAALPTKSMRSFPKRLVTCTIALQLRKRTLASAGPLLIKALRHSREADLAMGR